MSKKIYYTIALIIWALVLEHCLDDKIRIALSMIICILMIILFEIINLNKDK